MRAAFASDPERFRSFSANFGDLLLDWSKCLVDAETMQLLAALADAAQVEAKREAMFAGEEVNSTERRAALHIALRNRSNRPIAVLAAT